MSAGSNDFLPFAIGGSPNVVSQAVYAALGALATGYASGTAASNQLNKTWRQSSVMAAVMAQLACDQGMAMADDGVTATQIANMKTAVKGLRAGSLKAITTTPVSLVAADSGFVTIDATGGNRVVNLPACNVANGQPLEYNFLRTDNTANTVTINRAGSDTIDGATSFTLTGVGDKRSIVGDGSATWNTMGIPGAGSISSISSVIGSMLNAKMIITSVIATGTFTADEIIVGTALGGQTAKIVNFNKTINLGTTGAGGMDTGSSSSGGFVALYAIYNPTTGANNILATNLGTSGVAPPVYGGANMPSGYTMSALIGIWRNNGVNLFEKGAQRDRAIYQTAIQVLTTSVTGSSNLSITSVPANAKTVSGFGLMQSTIAGTISIELAPTSVGNGRLWMAGGSTYQGAPFSGLPIETAQSIYYTLNNSAGVPTFGVTINGFTF